MDFQSFLKDSGQKIHHILPSLFPKDTKQHIQIKKLTKKFVENVHGGKYIRGSLVLLGYSLAEKIENKDIISIAAAYEILHTSLLTLDDVIDNSPLRRGKPSLFKQVGTNQALCLSDMGFFLTNIILAASNFDTEVKIKAISLLNNVVLDTINGEMLDVTLSDKIHTKRNEKDVLYIHQLKTASYSISGPLLLGALLANMDERTLQAIKLFGDYLGIAFQIHDDILGTFGDDKRLGKSVTSDIEENKNTLLIIYALLTANHYQKEFIKTHYGQKNISEKDFQHLRKIFEETGALVYSQKKAQFYDKKAKKMITKITKNTKIQKYLMELTNFVVQRNK